MHHTGVLQILEDVLEFVNTPEVPPGDGLMGQDVEECLPVRVGVAQLGSVVVQLRHW